MSGRILLVEPDAAARSLMDRILAAEGHAVDAVASIGEARARLDDGRAVDLLIVDEMGARRTVLADARTLRQEYPAIPMIVTGALLSPTVMREALRLHVADALAKPFTPDELREAAQRVLDQRATRHGDAMELAAGVESARRAIAEGRLPDAASALRRAQAMCPFDAEVMALFALAAELEGRDDDADRGYRAALALRHDEDTPAPDPHEGLARLAAYGSARPARTLREDRRRLPIWIVTEPASELALPSPVGDAPCVVLISLGLVASGPDALFFRDGDGPRAFVLTPGAHRGAALAALIDGLGAGEIVAATPTLASLDVAAVTALRRGA